MFVKQEELRNEKKQQANDPQRIMKKGRNMKGA